MRHELVLACLLAAGSVHADPVSTITTGSADLPRQLASSYAPANRPIAEHMFADMLGAYANVERSLGSQPGDAATAAAALIVSAYEIVHDTRIDRSVVPRVIDQMHVVVGTDPSFVRADAAGRRVFYEQMAILVMMQAKERDTLGSSPDPARAAKLRDTARKNLASYGNPASIRIDANGVSLGGARAQPAAPAPAAPKSAPAVPPDLDQIAIVGATMDLANYRANFFLLLKSGTSLARTEALGQPGTLAAWAKKYPHDVSKWRKVDGKYEVLNGSQWERMRATYKPEPAGRKIAGSYHTSANPTMGATYGAGASNVSFSSWRDITFAADGRFSMGGGHGVTVAAQPDRPLNRGVDVHSQTRDGARGGTYRIAGYLLTLTFDDGTVVTHSLIINSQHTLYIDGNGWRGG